MMNMMYTNGPGSGLIFFFVLHSIAMIAFFVGVALLLMWASKKLTEKNLWKWGWILVVAGIVAGLLTFPSMIFSHGGGTFGMMRGGTSTMMGDGWQNAESGSKSEAQMKEEAEGKALYEKLQAKEMTCADVSDDEFELIGEYAMGLRTGDSHEQMNDRIKQMMGDEGEVQMHVALGKSTAGCATGTTSGSFNGGMMNNGMMMNANNDAMSMSMNDMSLMLKEKTGDDFDQAFLQGMIPHHQGAIDMAKLAEANAKHQEIKDLAKGIIAAQQEEIDMMNLWLKNWGYTK